MGRQLRDKSCYERMSIFFTVLIVFLSQVLSTVALQSLTDFKNSLHLNSAQAKTLNSSTTLTPCTCAVFLSGQFTKGSPRPPTGNPALIHEQERTFPCTHAGMKQCQAKCLETIVKHLPNSADILCATIDRDCHRERAYLFVQNCEPKWHNTNLSAGREYCCKNGHPYQCSLNL